MSMNKKDEAPCHGKQWPRYNPVTLVICVGVILSVVAFVLARNSEDKTMEHHFRQASQGCASALESNIQQHLLIVESFAGLYSASQKVERQEFHIFAKPFMARHPDIQALEWIVHVRESQRAAYEQAARQDGFPHFQITERVVSWRDLCVWGDML